MQQARERQDNLTKPLGSLGLLENVAVRIAGITKQPRPRLGNKAVIVCAADHGVVQEGISAYPAEVTPQMVMNFLNEGAAINVLAKVVGAKVVVADVGMAAPKITHSRLINLRIKSGTDNFVKGPAMNREEGIRALEAGIMLAQKEIDAGATVLATGEMGIGNTTASSAIVAAITNSSPELVTGTGTGLQQSSVPNKINVISQALAVNNPDPQSGLDVLTKVGGIEIGALAGVILGGAARRVPVVIDGFISTAAALVADRLAPMCRQYMFASHLSYEPGHRMALEALQLTPMLHLQMRVGEGTGAVLAFPLLEAAVRTLDEMATFAEAAVSNALN
jgi:nicotinate-nucleotide--dimethylbenzimidazole phosphoribosyltransferase